MTVFYCLCFISAWIFAILLASYLTKKYLPSKKEFTRKIVHIGIGPIILFAWWFELPKLIASTTAAVILFGLIINYRLRLFAAIEDIQRKSFGTIAYGLSITTLLILFWPDNAAAVSFGVLSMALGDGFAGLIGQEVRSPNWLILEQKKSVAGTISMGVIVSLISISLLSLIDVPIIPIKIIMLAILSIVLEQISPWGIDNLTVPIGLTFAWLWIIN